MSTDHADIQMMGNAISVRSAQIDGRAVVVAGRWIKIATLKDEDLVDGQAVAGPQVLVARLKEAGLKVDIFTFAQKLPDIVPIYPYYLEWDNPAVIPIASFRDWWDKRVESSVRRADRKASKLRVVAKEAEFDDVLVAIGRLPRTKPQGVEQTTSEVPRGPERAVVVYRFDSSEAVEGLARTVSKLGAQVRITRIAREVPPVSAWTAGGT